MLLVNPRSFPGVVFLAAMVAVIASRAEVADADQFLYIPYNGMDADKFGKHGPYKATDPLRQHLHLYQTPSKQPTPVYLYSHADGGTAALTEATLKLIESTGYSTISWESETIISPKTTTNCWKDFELVWSWLKANAVKYNLDPDSVIVGGRSRGTCCSWPMAYSERPEVKGIYMYNVLPDTAWVKKFELGSSYSWDHAVTKNAPPAHFLFGPECPKPITQNCRPSPKKKDIHNPKNGQTIVDVYNKLGIGSKIQLTDALTNNHIGAHDLFPEFVASLSSSSTSMGSSSAGVGSSSTSSVGVGSSVTTATSSSSDAASAAGSSGKDFFSKLFIISVCVVFAAFGYNKYYKKITMRKRKNSYRDGGELNSDDGGLRMQDMGNTSYRDEVEDGELNTNDGILSMQDMDKNSYRGKRKQLDGIFVFH